MHDDVPKPVPRWFRLRRLAWIARHCLGRMLNRLLWRVLDPHDSWMIEYQDRSCVRTGGRRYCETRTCFYHLARARARELHGEIVGHSVTIIPAGGPGEAVS